MKHSIIVLTLLACCAAIFAAPADKQITKSTFVWLDGHSTRIIVGKRGEHHFTVRLSEGPLRKDMHVFRNRKGEIIPGDKIKILGSHSGFISIDGNFDPIGTDYGLPSTEFYAFDVMVDGKKWEVPKELWADCYLPKISGKLWVTLSADGKRLAMGKISSDGAGSYAPIWYLHADGHSSRNIMDLETYTFSFKKHSQILPFSNHPDSNKTSSNTK